MESIRIVDRGSIVFVKIEDVLYFRASAKYVDVVTAKRTYLIEDSIARFEKELPNFIRVHRNCLVAKNRISHFVSAPKVHGHNFWVVLESGTKVRMSRREAKTARAWAEENQYNILRDDHVADEFETA